MPKSSDQPGLFSRRLRAARLIRGLRQSALAERARLQQTAVSHYESGKRRPSLRNLRRLAEALEVTTDYLVGHTDDPSPPATTGEPLLRDFGRLSSADRELARELVAQLARRASSRERRR